MSNGAGIAAGVACGIATILIAMSCIVTLCAAGAAIPVTAGIFVPFGTVLVRVP